jgi:diguanylate cyclase (GGDEF)-like protein
MNELTRQLLLMLLEAGLVAGLLLALFAARRVLGFASLYTTVGVLYYLATLLAGTTFVHVAPGMLMSPGSVALFPACLFAVLLVYIREDAREARNMIYGLLAANITASLLGVVAAQHLQVPLSFNPMALPPELFVQSPRLIVVGTLALYADTLLVILTYEALSRFALPLLARIWIALALVLMFDTLLFVTGGFVENPAYLEILFSGMAGKLAASVVYALALRIYLARGVDSEDEHPRLGDLFGVLTYRQKYEALRAQAMRDPLTGVHNRGFFDDVLLSQLAAAERNGGTVSVAMVDVDHFKRVNDQYGHAEGDRALRVIAQALVDVVRTADVVCRYGGEEFCLILPDTSIEQAELLAGRVREAVPLACKASNVAGGLRITVTIGIASFPDDGRDAETIMNLADRRMYRGKEAGRDWQVSA